MTDYVVEVELLEFCLLCDQLNTVIWNCQCYGDLGKERYVTLNYVLSVCQAKKKKSGLKMSVVNRPFSGCSLASVLKRVFPPTTIHLKKCFAYKFIFMQIKIVSTWNVLLEGSFTDQAEEQANRRRDHRLKTKLNNWCFTHLRPPFWSWF